MLDTKENPKHEIYEIFPTIIYRGEISCHRAFKEKYQEELCNYWHFAEDLPREELQSPENSGRYFLHHEEKYKDFFKCLSDNVRQYLKILEIDDSLLNVNVTKSWLNIHKENLPNIKTHIHNCSDISFCYYLNCNETSDKLCFHQAKNNNEVSEFMFETTVSGKYNLIKSYNKYNCNNYISTPIEGTVILFPSSLMHSTIKMQERVGTRISICGDITLTVVEDYIKCEYSRVDPSLWRRF
jgi:uncharacterized protein (TIGR02466 family)